MTQHTELIERLRRRAWLAKSGTTTDIHLIEDEAISALEAQAREIEGLRVELDRAHKVAALIREGLKTIPQDEHVLAIRAINTEGEGNAV